MTAPGSASKPHVDLPHSRSEEVVVRDSIDGAALNSPVKGYVTGQYGRYHPRPETEWQGMLADRGATPPCYEGFCQSALACVDQQCGPCSKDSECVSGEVCVLDHCLVKELAQCRRASDCPEPELCVLSGLSDGDMRGNRDMKALCSGAVEPPRQADAPAIPDEAFVGSESRLTRLNQAMDAQGAP